MNSLTYKRRGFGYYYKYLLYTKTCSRPSFISVVLKFKVTWNNVQKALRGDYIVKKYKFNYFVRGEWGGGKLS